MQNVDKVDLPGDQEEKLSGAANQVAEDMAAARDGQAEVLAGEPKTTRRLLDILPHYTEINGWMSVPEAQLLFSCASASSGGCIVEIGCYRGRSTAALCAGVSVGGSGPVYAIDPHEDFVGVKGAKFGPGDRRAFFRTMIETQMVKHVRLLNTTSRAASIGWTRKVALLFLDGDHRYESTLSDFECWRTHLLDGAKVIIADAQDEGPARVIAEFTLRKMLTHEKTVGKLAVFTYAAVDHAPKIYPKIVVDETIIQKNLNTETVAYNVYYGGGGKYLYQSIPKCACTSIKTVLLELEGLPVDDDEWKRHQKDRNKFPGADGLTPRQLNELFRDKTDTFKFVIVRDPYTRLASAYQDKIKMVTKLRAKYWQDLIKASAEEQGVTLSDQITFDEFVQVVSHQSIEEMDAHWRPQYFEGRFGIIKFNFVGHMEMLHSDLPYILERIGAPQHLLDKAAAPQNVTGAHMAMWDTVKPETRRAYLKTFAIDFDTLRYPYRTQKTW